MEETGIMLAVSAAHHRISYIHGRDISPMEDMPAGRTARTRKRNTRVSVLREPLIERFGQEWYDELKLACETYLADQC